MAKTSLPKMFTEPCRMHPILHGLWLEPDIVPANVSQALRVCDNLGRALGKLPNPVEVLLSLGGNITARGLGLLLQDTARLRSLELRFGLKGFTLPGGDAEYNTLRSLLFGI